MKVSRFEIKASIGNKLFKNSIISTDCQEWRGSCQNYEILTIQLEESDFLLHPPDIV